MRPKTLFSSLLFALPVISTAAMQSARAANAPAPVPQGTSVSVRQGTPAPLSQEERTLQMLNRFTFGLRPGDIAAVQAAGGPEAWFEQQLRPDSISDPVASERLAQYPALNLIPEQLVYNFPSQRIVREVAEGKRPMPQEPLLAGMYATLVSKWNRKVQKKAAGGGQPVHGGKLMTAMQMPPGPESDEANGLEKKQEQARAMALSSRIITLPASHRMAAVMALPMDDRIVLTGRLPEAQRRQLLDGLTPRERDLFLAMTGGPNATHVIAGELQQAKLLRAVLSERQLEEVMTDFWFNHFNVFLGKEQDSIYVPSYERDAIRAHALGKFRDLLLATAQHPAMLVYLDNWQSIGPDSVASARQRQNGKNGQRGLNENYGREVMELHTVGVNGGYTQADVTALARILTGWSIERPEDGGGFVFRPRAHEPGSKHWFGATVRENGYEEGRQALTLLAASPQTAHYISYELAQRFVADEPSPALVDRMAQAFLSSDGDIRTVLRTMVHSPEFWSRDNYRNKVKVPLEFVASAYRATATDPANPEAAIRVLKTMGEPLYGMQPPTGYPMTADHWMNSAALLDRLNFSLVLANNRLPETHFDAAKLLASTSDAAPQLVTTHPREARTAALHAGAIPAASSVSPSTDRALAALEQTLTGGAVSARTDSVIRAQIAVSPSAAKGNVTAGALPPALLDGITALLLGSPEFQMR